MMKGRKNNKKDDSENSHRTKGFNNNNNKDNSFKRNQHLTIQQKQNQAIADFQMQNHNEINVSTQLDYKTFILLRNQENIDLYNNEIKYLSIKKLNINSEAFIPKSKQQTTINIDK